MKQFIKHTPYLVSLLILLGITSCTKMDEYLKYTDGKEILYTGCHVFRLQPGGLPRSTGIRP